MNRIKVLWPILQKYEIIFASLFIMVMVILMTFKLLLPNFTKANQILLQREDLADKLGRLETKNKFLSSLDENYYKKAFSNFEGVLPKSKDYVTLFSTFDTLQSKSGVTILGTQFQLGAVSTEAASILRSKKSIAYMVPMTVDVIGTDAQLRDFISGLTDLSGRLITIDSSLWKPKEGGFTQVALKGNAYFYPQVSTILTIDKQLPKVDQEDELLLSQIYSNTQNSYDVDFDDRDVTAGKRNLFE